MCDVAYVLILDEAQRLGDQQRLAVAFARANGAKDVADPHAPDEIRRLLDEALAEAIPDPTPRLPRDQHQTELMQALGIVR